MNTNKKYEETINIKSLKKKIAEIVEIIDKLESGLSFGKCGWCV